MRFEVNVRGALALGSLVVIGLGFLEPLTHGFGKLFGDFYDTNIEIAILEHWWNVFRGRAFWAETGYFFPHQGTLAYNDGYLLYGVLYAGFRIFLDDLFLSAFATHLLVRLIGYFCFFVFARRWLRLSRLYAAGGGVIFSSANGLYVHELHAQLLSVMLGPLALHFLLLSLEHWRVGREGRGGVSFAGFSVVYGLWALTAFYSLWFFTFLMMLAALGGLLQGVPSVKAALIMPFRTKLRCLCVLTSLIIALFPFLWLYLPKASESGMHAYDTILANFLPTGWDILNIGPFNGMWGHLIIFLNRLVGFPSDFTENQTGLTPVLLLLFLWGFFRLQGGFAKVPPPLLLAARLSAVTAILFYAVSLKLGDASLWAWVYQFVPGAKAVRVVARGYLSLGFPILITVLAFLESMRPRRPLLALSLLCFVIVEQVNFKPRDRIDREALTARIRTASAALPTECQSFYVRDHRPVRPGNVEEGLYRHNVEAMLVAEYSGIPTINGYSSFMPRDWHFENSDPEGDYYQGQVESYLKSHQLQRVCQLDLATLAAEKVAETWERPAPLGPLELP